MKYSLALFAWMVFPFLLNAQLPAPLMQLRQGTDSGARAIGLYDAKGLNYLAPVRVQAKQAPAGAGDLSFEQYGSIARDLAFAGDYTSAPYFGKLQYDSMPPEGYADARNYIDTMKAARLSDARSYILQRVKSERMIMFNETPFLPQHRAFLLSMLAELQQAGFRYLALEMLRDRRGAIITEMDMRAGYLAAEPLAGELIRKAISLGMELVPFEDTAAHKHTALGRDAIRAGKLAAIFRKDTAARVIVLAEGMHISEKKIGQQVVPLAAAFRQFSGIDPFTIDQTEMSSGSTFEYGRYFYEQLSGKRSFNQPVIAFRQQGPVSLVENDLYDLQVIHPVPRLLHGRPDWLTVSGQRKETPVRPTEKTLYLVQAYYASETIGRPLEQLVPADQTYLTGADGYYWLFLYPGKYRVVLRDINYKVLDTRDLEVAG